MKENGRGFVIPSEDKAIPGIKRLVMAEQAARNDGDVVIAGIWYVDGIPYGVHKLQDAVAIRERHEADIVNFRKLNEKINSRGTRR